MQSSPCSCLLCRRAHEESSWDSRDRRVATAVRSHGWNIIAVAEEPGWSYSVGLWHTVRRPEVCVFGLPSQTAMSLLYIVCNRVRQGAVLRPGERRTDIVPELEVAIRPVRAEWYLSYFGAALDFYDDPLPPLLQVCWPDDQRRFAWETGVNAAMRDSQPMLWLRREEHPPGAWALPADDLS